MKHNKGEIQKWYPFWIDKWIWGSTRHELIIHDGDSFVDLRGIFVDLLTLSKKDGGFIRANENTPYKHEQLAGLFCVPVDMLRLCIEICLKPEVGKLREPLEGIYYVASSGDYDISNSYKYRLVKANEESSQKSEQGSKISDSILDKTREDKTREDKSNKHKPKSLDEIIPYFQELLIPNEAPFFFDYYEANGWVQGKQGKPIKDWKAAARNWKRNKEKYNGNNRTNSKPNAGTVAARTAFRHGEQELKNLETLKATLDQRDRERRERS